MGKPGKKAGKGLLAPTNPNRRVDPNKTSLRDQRTIKRLKMYKSKIKRDEKGNIVKGSVLKASDRVETQMTRIAPDRRWFGNTRTIGQDALQTFREEMGAKYRDPYSVIIKQSKLPLSLLEEPKVKDGSIRQEMQWAKTFGDKSTRKRVRMNAYSMSTFAEQASSKCDDYIANKKSKDRNLVLPEAAPRSDRSKNGILFTKGQSNRIWCELYKVIDSSDVILYVVDARDPLGTRSSFIEDFMKKEKKYKHFVLVLNKCDLVPLWAAARWLQVLSKDYPTIAFHASVNHPFGKGNLISLLRQFVQLHNVTHRGSKRTKTPISVGVIGYPNVGKSSLINTLRRKSVCKVAPIPGETKVWQYVALTRSIFLIDCPGVVYDRESNNDVQAVLKGVVRVERLGNADKTDVVHTVLQIVKKADVVATYGVSSWRDAIDFLEQLAKLRGKLVAGGEPDVEAVARMVLYDWQRGRLPWFNAPPFDTNKHFRDAQVQPAERQMKLIENYSTFNVDEEKGTMDRTPLEHDGNEGGRAEDGRVGGADEDEESGKPDDDDDGGALEQKHHGLALQRNEKYSHQNSSSNANTGNNHPLAKKQTGLRAEGRAKPATAGRASAKTNSDSTTVLTYMQRQEEEARRRKKISRKEGKLVSARRDREGAMAAEYADEGHDADEDGQGEEMPDVDALWSQFLAAAKE